MINIDMRIVEILLPKGTPDRTLSSKQIRDIHMLQSRMTQYVDKILDPNTTVQGKEFLKSRLRDDYYDLKDALKPIGIDTFVENPMPVQQYEVIDIVTKKVVGGPYLDRTKARRAADKKDLAYGAIRYRVRPVGGEQTVMEAIHTLPITNEDFELVRTLMDNPIPAVIARIYINEVIDDDEFNDQIISLEDTDPGRDIRPLIVEWFKRVMPDQMARFGQEKATVDQKKGIFSPLHGYDPHQYHGQNEPITGNAYGLK